jgi:hypothetical protein
MLEHGPQGLQIGFSNGILFLALGSIQGYKVQLGAKFGQIGNIFSISALILVKSPWGQIQLLHQ